MCGYIAQYLRADGHEIPIKDHEWYVARIANNLHEIKYKFPRFLNQIINLAYKHGDEKALFLKDGLKVRGRLHTHFIPI